MIDKFEGKYFFLSNFYPSPLPMIVGALYPEEIVAPTVEHAYQAQKTIDLQHQQRILRAPTPNQAKRFGLRAPLRPNWEEIKDDVMKDLLLYKFANPDFKERLLATDDHELVEGNWWGDTYWGVCKGKGQNKLGKLLMEVREYYGFVDG